MADETRRSGRATKGQHSHKDKELAEAAMPKAKKGAKKGKKAKSEASDTEEQSDDIIRCICGATVDAEDGSVMIACDNCLTWQHNVCMAVKGDPEAYFCERCKPEEHADLMEQLKTKSALLIAAERIAAAPKKGRPKFPEGFEDFGKKRRSGRHDLKADAPISQQTSPQPSEVKAGSKRSPPAEETVQNGQTNSSQPETKAPETTQKPSKRRRVSPSGSASLPKAQPAEPEPKTEAGAEELPADQSSLPDQRRKPVDALVKALSDSIKTLTKDQTFSDDGPYRIPDGETPQSLALHYAIGMEHELFRSVGAPQGRYVDQMRAIRFNLKKNPELTKQLVLGQLQAAQFAHLSPEDMADEETKKKDAIERERAEKQAFAIQADGRRIITDHKGPRYIGGDEEQGFQTLATTAVTETGLRRESIMSTERPPTSHSQDEGSPMKVELPEDIGSSHRPSLSVDTKRQSNASEFNINKILEQTPVHANNGLRPLQHAPRRRSGGARQSTASQNIEDADVDRLLEDEGWTGRVSMSGVPNFSVQGQYIAGADYSDHLSRHHLLRPELNITGRISTDTADQYVTQMRHSATRDVVVFKLIPNNEEDATPLSQVWQYCFDKARWGVIHADGLREDVQDAYIIPIEQGEEPLPSFLDVLIPNHILQPRPERLLLLALIIKHQRSPSTPHALATPVRPSETPVLGSYAHSGTGLGVNFTGTPLDAPIDPQPTDTAIYGPTPADAPPLAAAILGGMLNFPVLRENPMRGMLPTMDGRILGNLREFLEDHPEARTDFGVLGRVLGQRG